MFHGRWPMWGVDHRHYAAQRSGWALPRNARIGAEHAGYLPLSPYAMTANRRSDMGEIKDRAKGFMDETIGKTKRAVGAAIDRPDIEAEGHVQEAKGDAEKAKARAEHELKR